MFQPKIVFFDIDDTLWIKCERRIPDSTKLALRKLHERGIITAIATGRTIAVLPEPIRALAQECDMEMFVSINGQYVEYQGKKLVSFPLENQIIEQVISILQQQGVAYAHVSRSGVWASALEERLQDAATALGIPIQVNGDYYKENEVYQLLAFYPQALDEQLVPHYPESLRPIRWHTNGVDLLDKQGSKARGIQAALDALGLTLADAMAFGDELNDLEMIASVGCGVAMGNAVPELKAIADFIAPNIEDDGIYRALVELQIID